MSVLIITILVLTLIQLLMKRSDSASMRAIYVDRKPATTIYIINGRPRVISEMGNGAR